MPVRTTAGQQRFLDSPEGIDTRITLEAMESNPAFNTAVGPSFTGGANLSFTDKHLKYLSEHPKLDPLQYLANLRLKTRIR